MTSFFKLIEPSRFLVPSRLTLVSRSGGKIHRYSFHHIPCSLIAITILKLLFQLQWSTVVRLPFWHLKVSPTSVFQRLNLGGVPGFELVIVRTMLYFDMLGFVKSTFCLHLSNINSSMNFSKFLFKST